MLARTSDFELVSTRHEDGLTIVMPPELADGVGP
jgi:hypothetical protein